MRGWGPLFLCLLVAVGCVGAQTLCTVSSGGGDFATLQAALDGCNGGTGEIVLLVDPADVQTGPLIFPIALTNVRIEPLVAGRINILGAGHYIDPFYSWTTLTMVNVTFDGLFTTGGAFEPRLTNTNFTCQRCFWVQFAGPYIYRHESCVESTQITFTENVWADVPGNAVEIYAAESIVFVDNTCRRCSGNVDAAFGAVWFFHIHDISRGRFILNGNAVWRLFDEQLIRCRYYLDTDANVRCSQVGTTNLGDAIMQLQCFDRITTEDLGFCSKGSQTFPDQLSNLTIQVNNDYLVQCRSYRECQCNVVQFTGIQNGSNVLIERVAGDVFYGARTNPTDVVLPCVPDGVVDPGVGLACSQVFNQYSNDLDYDETTCANAYSIAGIPPQGHIDNPCVCPPDEDRVRNPEDLRDPDDFPCRYSFQEGILCQEEVPLCCAEPYWTYPDARYYARTCGQASLAEQPMFHYLLNMTDLWLDFDINYNATHYQVTGSLSNPDGLYGPLVRVFPHSTGGALVFATLPTSTTVDTAAVYTGNPTGDTASFSAVLEQDSPVSGSAQLTTQSLADTWTYAFTAYGQTQVVPIVGGNPDEYCVDHTEVVAQVNEFHIALDTAFDGSTTIYLPSNAFVNQLQVVYAENYNSTNLTRVQLFVDGAVTPEDEIFLLVPATGVLYYNGANNYVQVFLGGSGIGERRRGELEVSLPNEEILLLHEWALILVGFVERMRVTTTFGLDSDTQTVAPAFASQYSADTWVERVPRFFDLVLQQGCSGDISDPECLFIRDCDPLAVNCDRTVSADLCEVLSCYGAFNELIDVVVFNLTVYTSNTTGNVTYPLDPPQAQVLFDGVLTWFPLVEVLSENATLNSSYPVVVDVNGTNVTYYGTLYVNVSLGGGVKFELVPFALGTYTLVQPTVSGQSLPYAGILDLCTVVPLANLSGSLVNGSTTDLPFDAGWLFRPDGRWRPELMDNVSAAAWNDPSAWPAPDGLPLQYAPEPVNRVMGECCSKLYRTCSCAALDPGAGDQNVTAFYWPDSNYTCLADAGNTTLVPYCPCNNDIYGQIYPAGNYTSAIRIEHLPPLLSFFQMLDNRAQQLYWGAYIEDVPYELVDAFSFAQPKPRTADALLREINDNDNEYVQGNEHDLVENPPPLEPRFAGDTLQLDWHRWCDDGCPVFFITEEEFACIVDKEATPDVPGWGVTVFENITDAIARAEQDGGCRGTPGSGKNRTILVRYTEQYYDETMDMTKDSRNMLIASLDGALVVGSDHQVDGRVDTALFRGMAIRHARENKKPFFVVDRRTLTQFRWENVDFYGEQVRAGGIINGNVLELIAQFCSFNDFEQYAMRVDDTCLRAEVTNCQFINSVGRVIFIKFDQRVQIVDNAMINTRGGADYKEAAIVTLRARSPDACQEWDEDEDADLVPAANPQVCKLIKVHQLISLFDSDERDQCFWLDRGNWNAQRIRENRCVKAQFGLTLARVNGWQADSLSWHVGLRYGSLQEAALYNPFTQPSITRNVSQTSRVGWDLRLRSPVPRPGLNGEDVINFFFSGSNTERNFADLGENRAWRPSPGNYRWELDSLWFNLTLQCQVNNNYNDYNHDHRRVPPFDAYPNVRFVHGFYQYHNVSLAAIYCVDRGVLIGSDPRVYVTSWNGSHIRQDNITLARDIWLIGDTSEPHTWCTIDDILGRYPVISGHDHLLAAAFINMTRLAYWLDIYEDLLPTSLWRTYNVPQTGLMFDRVIFDGRSKIPVSQMRVLDLVIGQVVEFPLDKAGNIKTNKPLPASEGLFEMYNCTVRDFIDFEGRVVDPLTGEVEIVDDFPFTDGVRIECLNDLNAFTVAVIQNSSFLNMDRNALWIENCLRVYGMDNLFLNISGRSRANRQAVYLEGNPLNTTANASLLFWHNNTATQNKTVLFPQSGQRVNPAYVTSYWLHGWPNTTLFCFQNNRASGLGVGYRLTASQRSIMMSCLPQNATIPFFPDRKRELRALCVYGNNSEVDGFWHDMVWDREPGTQDRWRNNDWCDECCPLTDPDICYVDAVPEILVPENPWYDRFLFGSINRALQLCAASNRFIYLVGRQNIWGVFPDQLAGPVGFSLVSGGGGERPEDRFTEETVPFKEYCEQIDVSPLEPRFFLFNVLNETSNTTYNISVVDYSRATVAGAWGHHICSRGHRMDLSAGVQATFQGLNFSHCTEACVPGDGGNTAIATWHQPPGYNSSGLHLDGNLWNGRLQTDARPQDGVYYDGFRFRDNELDNYTGPVGSRFLGLQCTEPNFLLIDTNRWEDFAGEALFIDETNSLQLHGNRFVRCGGQVASPLWATYVSQCHDVEPGVFSLQDNRWREHSQTVYGPEYHATLWIGYIDLASKRWRIKRNCMDPGHEVGLRFEDAPGFTRATLRAYFLDPNDQLCLDGSKRDMVIGAPADDGAIEADPHAERQRWCNDGCTATDWTLLGLIFGALFLLALVCALLAFYYCCPSCWTSQGGRTFTSRYLGIELPINRHRWIKPGDVQWHQPDGGFDRQQALPRTDEVAPGVRFSQEQHDRQTGWGTRLPPPGAGLIGSNRGAAARAAGAGAGRTGARRERSAGGERRESRIEGEREEHERHRAAEAIVAAALDEPLAPASSSTSPSSSSASASYSSSSSPGNFDWIDLSNGFDAAAARRRPPGRGS